MTPEREALAGLSLAVWEHCREGGMPTGLYAAYQKASVVLADINEDIKALRDALDAVNSAKESLACMEALKKLRSAANPASIARLLAALETTRDALKGVAEHIEGRLPTLGYLRDNEKSRAALGKVLYVLEHFEGKTNG